MLEHLSYAEISTDKIQHNVRVIKDALDKDCKLMIVVKGDAYGHGMIPFIGELDKNPDVDAIAVATVEEAKRCMKNKFSKPILVFNHILTPYIRLLKNHLDQVIFSVYHMKMALELSRMGIAFGEKIRVHIRIDIYESGKGMSLVECKENFDLLWNLSGIQIEGIYMHSYEAYEFQEAEIRKDLEPFDTFIKDMKPEIRSKLCVHAATSVMIFSYPEYHYDMVRIGAAVYGLPVSPKEDASKELKPIMSIVGRIIDIVMLTEQSRINYNNQKKKLQQPKLVAHVAFGFWEAPKIMDQKDICVNVNGKVTKMIGDPCMDSCCIDMTGLEDVEIGSRVYFLGDFEGVRIQDKMKSYHLGLSDCHLLFAGNARLPKIYGEWQKNSVEFLMTQVVEAAPTLQKTIATYRQCSLLDYLNYLKPENLKETKTNDELFEAIYEMTCEFFDEDKAMDVKKTLEKTMLLHTANHFCVEYLPQCIQGNLLYYKWLTLHNGETKTVPLFACTTTPMRSENFPRGILNYHDKSGKKTPLKVPILPIKDRSVMVGQAEGFSEEMIEKAKKQYNKYLQSKVINFDTYDTMMKILEEYEKKEILESNTYLKQAAKLNERLGKKILPEESVSFLYLPMEKIVKKLLIKNLEEENTLFYSIMWNPQIRTTVLQHLDGLQGCWKNESLEKIKDWEEGESILYYAVGTHFFWGVDSFLIRYPLCFAEREGKFFLEGVTSDSKKVTFELTVSRLKEYLETERMVPGMFITFLEIYFTRNVTIAGGCFQEAYIDEMQNALVNALEGFEILQEERNFIKKKKEAVYLSGPIFALDQMDTCDGESQTGPMGLVEILEKQGFTMEQFEKLLQVNYYEAHKMGLFNFYNDIVSKKDKNPNWMSVLKNELKETVLR
ncbi:MAG: alanine racemase [Acetivibrio sp.]